MELGITGQGPFGEELIESLPNISLYIQDGELEKFNILDPHNISYSDFYQDYLKLNRPCIFSQSMTSGWAAIRDWTVAGNPAENRESQINYDFLIQNYGPCTVSVTNCDDLELNYDNLPCTSMSVVEYLTYLERNRKNTSPPKPCLYLKDWHIIRNSPNQEVPYQVPTFFASDWLNEAAEEQGDDFRFVYIGPRGSWTPFHADVYGSFSWSANVIGTKKWFLYPPGKEERFRTKSNRIQFDPKNPGVDGTDFYEVIQGPGQVIFVPSGWHHIVWNLEDTISINHNWMNAANVGYIWANLKSAFVDVQKELDDLKDAIDFPDICQGLLKANHGMNFFSFVQILSTIAANRKDQVSHVPEYVLGPNHVSFDLSVLEQLWMRMKSDPAVGHLQDASAAFREAFHNFEALVST